MAMTQFERLSTGIMIDDLKTRLNSALCHNEDEEVIKICNMNPEHSLHKCSIHNCTVLHKASYLKKFELANELFDQLPENLLSRLIDERNNWGNTILHNASTSNKCIDLMRKLLQAEPNLLQVRNNWGETAVFQATRYGKKKSFEYLEGEVNKFLGLHKEFNSLVFFQRDDKTTILHMAILAGNYDTALIIAEKYPDLCGILAQDRMTALQLLACSPGAFRSGTKIGFFNELVYSSVLCDDDQGRMTNDVGLMVGMIQKAFRFILSTAEHCCTLPVIEEVRAVKKSHRDALELAKILIRLDTSWKNTYKPYAEVIPLVMGANLFEEDVDARESREIRCSNGTSDDVDETPLLLAAKTGCAEIVEEILKIFPQSLDYLNHDRQNLLLVAIKNRNLNIFKVVEQLLPIRDRIRDVDKDGNSILHMVAKPKPEVIVDTKVKSPVLQLSESLLLLEYLKKLSPSCMVNHRNNEMMTADEMFAMNNEKLRTEAKDWLKRTAEHCTVVIVLIATVAFAAAYTIPGGPNQETGFPLLLGRPFFLVFTVTDVLSLGFALTAVVIFLAILTSSFELKDFTRSLPQKLLLGFTLLFLSVSMMMVAFAATVILMIHNRERWTKIAVYVVAFFPVCIFVLSYIPLYVQLAEIFKYWVKKIGSSLPRSQCATKLARV